MDSEYLQKGFTPSFFEEFSKEWNEVLEIWQGVQKDLSKILIVPKKKNEHMRSNSRWTKEEVEQFYRLKQQRYTHKEIAQILGKTISTVGYLSKTIKRQEKEQYGRTL